MSDCSAAPVVSGPVVPEADEPAPGEDERDLAAAREGDHAAFARIYDRHAAVVLSLCRRSAGRRRHDFDEAEEALQETFIRAHRLLHTIDSPASLRSWLFGVARRVCSERRRSGARRARHEAEAVSILSHARSAPSVPERAAQDEALRRLDAALDALDEPERLAVHLYYLDPDPVRAARESLGLSRSGFYKLLARARDHLARLMQEAPHS